MVGGEGAGAAPSTSVTWESMSEKKRKWARSAQFVFVVDGHARLGEEEGGGASEEAGVLDEAAGVAAEEGEGGVASLVVDLGLAGLGVADHLEVEVEGFLLAEG